VLNYGYPFEYRDEERQTVGDLKVKVTQTAEGRLRQKSMPPEQEHAAIQK
jgi:hypothetical protein